MKFKYFKQTVALVLLLVILPAGSWYYLKSGFTFRKAALNELHEYVSLTRVSLENSLGKNVNIDSSHVYLLKLNDDEAFNVFFEKIMVAYESRTDVVSFQIQCDSSLIFQEKLVKGVTLLQPKAELCDKINFAVQQIIKESDKKPNVLLVNSKGFIVQGYDLNESNERARLIKHVSITMPGVKKVEKVLQKSIKEK